MSLVLPAFDEPTQCDESDDNQGHVSSSMDDPDTDVEDSSAFEIAGNLPVPTSHLHEPAGRPLGFYDANGSSKLQASSIIGELSNGPESVAFSIDCRTSVQNSIGMSSSQCMPSNSLESAAALGSAPGAASGADSGAAPPVNSPSASKGAPKVPPLCQPAANSSAQSPAQPPGQPPSCQAAHQLARLQGPSYTLQPEPAAGNSFHCDNVHKCDKAQGSQKRKRLIHRKSSRRQKPRVLFNASAFDVSDQAHLKPTGRQRKPRTFFDPSQYDVSNNEAERERRLKPRKTD